MAQIATESSCEAGFLNQGIIDILEWVIFLLCGLSYDGKIFSHISRVFLLDASSTIFSAVIRKMSPETASCPPAWAREEGDGTLLRSTTVRE